MRIVRTLLVGAVLTLAGSSAAFAGTKIMATGPAARFYPDFSQRIDCNILNMNTSAKTVTIDLMDYFGTVLASTGPLVLAPQTGASLGDTVDSTSWCRFSVEGSTKK